MANVTHIEILRQGIVAWNSWLKNNPHIKPDLSGISLTDANINGTALKISKSNRPNIAGVDFGSGYFRSTDFSGADLRGANFWNADLGFANFSNACLEGADFYHAIVTVLSNMT